VHTDRTDAGDHAADSGGSAAARTQHAVRDISVGELWSAQTAADYWGISLNRARAVLANRGIARVSGYPAHLIKAVQFRQGRRTDLHPVTATTSATSHPTWCTSDRSDIDYHRHRGAVTELAASTGGPIMLSKTSYHTLDSVT
ncbi:hypothetical protein ACWFOB_22965, partial [Bacillus subtilis]